MRALVVAPQPFFSPRGTPFSVYHRTRVTAELGVEVDFLTYGEGDDVVLPGVRLVRIPRLPGSVPVGPSWAKLWRDVLVLIWTVALLLRRRYDFVHAHEESVFFCRFLKPLFRFELVYDMHSSLPQQLVNFDFTRSRLLIGLFEALERSSLRAADAVITISPALADYALPLLPDARRHFLIENTLLDEVRLARPAGQDAGDEAAPVLPEGRPVVAYAGTFEAYQGIDLLLEAHARVLAERPEAYLLLVGGSPDGVARYRELARSLGIADHCLFTGRLPQPVTRALLSSATLVVSPRTTGTNTPLKIYELLAGGIPLVATRVPSHTQVLDGSVCFLAPAEPEGFARTVLEALGSPERRREVAAAARRLHETRYSAASYRSKMKALLESLR